MTEQQQITVHHFQTFKSGSVVADLRQNCVIASALKRKFPDFEVSVLGDFKQPWIEVQGTRSPKEKQLIEKKTVELIAQIQVNAEQTALT